MADKKLSISVVVTVAGKATPVELVQDKETKNMVRFALKANPAGVVGTIYMPRS